MSQLVACPECKKHLQVPDDLIGKKVQCPECKATFTAKSPDEEEAPPRTGTGIAKTTSSKKSDWNKKDDDDGDDDRGSRSGRSKRRDDYDSKDRDDDDDDELPRRSSRRSRYSSRSRYTAHRGGMILAFGLIGLIGGFTGLVFPVVFAIIAWIMGNSDMEEIRAGRMDPEGEGMTQAGRIMGMIATILFIVAILVTCGIFGCIILIPMMAIGGAAAGAGAGGPPRRR